MTNPQFDLERHLCQKFQQPGGSCAIRLTYVCDVSSSPLLCNDYNDGSVVNSRVASLCCFVVGAFFLWLTSPLFVEKKKNPVCFKGYDKAVCFACLLNLVSHD